jgi:hypothetical protein
MEYCQVSEHDVLASGTKEISFGTSGLSTSANELEVSIGEFVLSLSRSIATQATYYPLYFVGKNVGNSNPMGAISFPTPLTLL